MGAGSAVPCFDFSPLSVFAWVTCAARGFISDTIDASANWWLSRIKDKEEGERERERGFDDSDGNSLAHMSAERHTLRHRRMYVALISGRRDVNIIWRPF